MVSKVNIEVMIDTNANSRALDEVYDGLREVADQQEQESTHSRTIREFRDYLQKANYKSRTSYEVTQRDTAQIFHEKTHLFTPELAAKGGFEIFPRFVRENLDQGHYHVEPPVHGEQEYYTALETFLKTILPQKAPEDAERLENVSPENRELLLQSLYRDHMMQLPQKYRRGQYADAFTQYREVRFNAGEETAIHFLRNHELPPEGERTAFVFVGSDQWANKEMARARKGKDDQGRFEVFVVSPDNFHSLIEQVIRDIERDQPDMRQVRQSYRELSRMNSEPAGKQPVAGSRFLMSSLVAQDAPLLPAMKGSSVPSREARAFADFVLQSRAADKDSGPAR
jgi:hypothetical protein